MASLESLTTKLDKLRVGHGICKWLAVASLFLVTLVSFKLHSFLTLAVGMVCGVALAINAFMTYKQIIKLQKRIVIMQINNAIENSNV